MVKGRRPLDPKENIVEKTHLPNAVVKKFKNGYHVICDGYYWGFSQRWLSGDPNNGLPFSYKKNALRELEKIRNWQVEPPPKEEFADVIW